LTTVNPATLGAAGFGYPELLGHVHGFIMMAGLSKVVYRLGRVTGTITRGVGAACGPG